MIATLLAIGLVCGFIISVVLTPFFIKIAPRLGMLDHPSKHKTHTLAMPLLGGSAVFLAFALPALITIVIPFAWSYNALPISIPSAWRIHLAGASSAATKGFIILAGALALHILGLVDDRKNLGPAVKLLIQLTVSATVVIFAEIRVLTVAGEVISIILSIAWLVTIINAFNFMDNMDSLCAGVGAICSGTLLIIAMCMGQVFVSAWLALLLGSLLGFLPYNFPPAKIYLGDAGSLVLGFMLAVLSCLTTYTNPFTNGGGYIFGVFVPLILLAVPLYDTASVIIIRLRAGDNPMIGDRRHFSHRLLKRGMSVRKAVLTIYLCTLATGISAMILPHIANVFGAILIFSQTVTILGLIALLESNDKS